MLLLYMTVFCVLFGSSAGFEDQHVCYGKSFKLPYEYSPAVFREKLYFTPSRGPTRLLMDNGKNQTNDPRIQVNSGSVVFTDLRESDEGMFSISFSGVGRHNVISLRVLDCASKVTKFYGNSYRFSVPRQAEFLEYAPFDAKGQMTVLWNRTDPRTSTGGRGKLKGGQWEIKGLTQEDRGFYNIRKKDITLISRVQLDVEAYHRSYDLTENERLYINNPVSGVEWTVTFTPAFDVGEKITLIRSGRLVEDFWSSSNFDGRIDMLDDGIAIDPVKSTDTGAYYYKDPNGNLAMTVDVNVEEDKTVSIAATVSVVTGIVLVLIVCCCCIKKCCCKKSSSKREGSAPQTAAAPAMYYHDATQPAVPRYTAEPAPAYQPRNPPVSREPPITSLGPPVYNPVNIHVNPPQPEVAAPGGQGAPQAPSLNSGGLSSDTEPRFELKGLGFPSPPPLSSHTTFSNVYTSDKLNFQGAH